MSDALGDINVMGCMTSQEYGIDDALLAIANVSFSIGNIDSYPTSMELQLTRLQNIGLDDIDVDGFRAVVRHDVT